MNNQTTDTKPAPVAVATGDLLCPIFDRERQPMNVGDRFTYQFETSFASVAVIELRNGVEWLSFSDGTPSTQLADFWHAPTDEMLSRKHNIRRSDTP